MKVSSSFSGIWDGHAGSSKQTLLVLSKKYTSELARWRAHGNTSGWNLKIKITVKSTLRIVGRINILYQHRSLVVSFIGIFVNGLKTSKEQRKMTS